MDCQEQRHEPIEPCWQTIRTMRARQELGMMSPELLAALPPVCSTLLLGSWPSKMMRRHQGSLFLLTKSAWITLTSSDEAEPGGGVSRFPFMISLYSALLIYLQLINVML